MEKSRLINYLEGFKNIVHSPDNWVQADNNQWDGKYCLVDGVAAACSNFGIVIENDFHEVIEEIRKTLWDMKYFVDLGSSYYKDLFRINDDPNTTYDFIISVIDKTIERSKND